MAGEASTEGAKIFLDWMTGRTGGSSTSPHTNCLALLTTLPDDTTVMSTMVECATSGLRPAVHQRLDRAEHG